MRVASTVFFVQGSRKLGLESHFPEDMDGVELISEAPELGTNGL